MQEIRLFPPENRFNTHSSSTFISPLIDRKTIIRSIVPAIFTKMIFQKFYHTFSSHSKDENTFVRNHLLNFNAYNGLW